MAPELAFKPREYPALPLKATLDALPPRYPHAVIPQIHAQVASPKTPILAVLDDDPTGTQTCHNIAVLTVWDHDTLLHEFTNSATITTGGFFILTNSRALPPVQARKLITGICTALQKAAAEAGRLFCIVLRGDSTLRGHFPGEPETVEEALGKENVDAWVLCPFFEQGGRYTIEDVHYVAEKNELVPTAKTPFAEDKTFGYSSSNLRDYVLEKAGKAAGGQFKGEDIVSVSIEDIRQGGPERVCEVVRNVRKGSVVVVNAASESDMFVFAAGALKAEQKGSKLLYRTGAAFVSSRLGIESIPPLTIEQAIASSPSQTSTGLWDDREHVDDVTTPSNKKGGLIIAGSYVPKTTAQLASLRSRRGDKLRVIELDVNRLVGKGEDADLVIEKAIADVNHGIKYGEDVLVMTSRKLVVGGDALSSLEIGSVVAKALVTVVQGVSVRPRYIIAKGGITSSDAATKGLEMKRAMVIGQAAPGVPLWRCDEVTSKHTGVPYVVFPGNVGGDDTLADLVERWAL